MRTLPKLSLALGASLGLASTAGHVARADTAAAVVHVEDNQHGLVVLGLGNTVDVAWPLARSVYADAALRPTMLDEAHARVLVGEPPRDGADAAAAELRDLADTRGAIHGDDAASRRLLESIARALHVKGIVVVEAGATPTARPSARVFVTTASAYDPVHYDPDPAAPVTWGNGSSTAAWGGAVQALRRGFGEVPPPAPPAPPPPVVTPPPAPTPEQGISALALHPVPSAPAKNGKSESRAFYQSPWFWAAAGAAVFAAGAIYLATRADSTDNIQLQVQVPK